ncbi:hypothetical protein M514_02452 [Trichuris suis]|uniref:Reverse transcriptase domain-containing protein n=1 Tax=Trichuris suis TaxID=68888 RepID=A0A085MHS9_9BILA|nr:hypothetical protein M513_02452 [Trichuris suis]KFD68116.1 hypothetical protein M514_02452 [Trichuris suis]KHJ44553.1 hypothetical protein D918_05218 [Trichuris suis]
MIGLPGYKELGHSPYKLTNQLLKSYSGQQVPIKDSLTVPVPCGSRSRELPLLVTDLTNGCNLFGIDPFDAFNFDVYSAEESLVLLPMANQLRLNRVYVDNLREKYKHLFSPGLGRCVTFQAHLQLKAGAHPKFFKVRLIPFSCMDSVKQEVDRLTRSGIWKPVKSSAWAAPVVIVPKSSGSIRICGDFKLLVNSQLEIEQYPIPQIEKISQKLGKSQAFTKIDLSDAYLQIELDEESKAFMVVNTPYGLYQYQRLPFGVASAPSIFQRFTDQLMSGIPG